MVLELVRIRTTPGSSDAFPGVVNQARPLIAATAGFVRMDLRRCLEEPDRYVLLIEWRDMADHLEGFRQSDRYPRWRELLGPCYAAPPEVLHYAPA